MRNMISALLSDTSARGGSTAPLLRSLFKSSARRLTAVTILLASIGSTAAVADSFTNLGFGRMFTNDALGDGQDRWRTGAYVMSNLRGPKGLRAIPDRPGELYELRIGAHMIAPDNLTDGSANDRPYAGVLSTGLHTYFQRGTAEMRAGFDLVATGSETGLGQLHSWFHDRLNIVPPSDKVLEAQIGNKIHPTVSFEVAQPMALGRAVLRPFVSAQAGVESFVRLGGDLMFGPAYDNPVLLRDVTTGQLYQGLQQRSTPGWSFLVGGDVAHVFDSALLPDSGSVSLTETRPRARAGVQWQGARFGAFYGVTWLGKEFDQQSEGQLVGSLSLRMSF